MSIELSDIFAADTLVAAADAIRDCQAVYDAVDAYYRDRGVDADAKDVARALTEAAAYLHTGAEL